MDDSQEMPLTVIALSDFSKYHLDAAQRFVEAGGEIAKTVSLLSRWNWL
jgi:hypothetical protein